MEKESLSRIFLVVLVVAISATFVAMIRGFLLAIVLAAIFAGLAHPLYRRMLRPCRGRRMPASALTLVILLLVIVVPLGAILGIVTAQAINVSEAVAPWISEQLSEPDALSSLLDRAPFAEKLQPWRETILTRLGTLVGGASSFLISALSAGTRGTVTFLFQLFILLYAMFFLLIDGGALLRRILFYLPLDHEAEARMLAHFTSVTRATIKGTLLIGLTQGTLAGAAMAICGVEGAVFWGTLMVVLSVIPGIGTALVWAPASAILVAQGHTGTGIGLAAFCLVVVGSIDNFLRPRLVGRDTEMHDLLILLGTLGGITLFGAVGFIIGPIIAALFVTVWDIYGVTFRDVLPAVGPLGPREPEPDEEDAPEDSPDNSVEE